MLALSVALAVPLLLLTLLVEDDRTKRFLLAFVWGALAGSVAATVNDAAVARFGLAVRTLEIQFAPLAEEVIKAAPFLFLALAGSRLVRSREVILAAVFAGFGFSVVENFSYLLRQVGADSTELVVFVATRSVSTTVMHGVATGVVGLTIYLVTRASIDGLDGGVLRGENGTVSTRLRATTHVLVGYSVAVTFHALFNVVVQFRVLGRVVGVTGALVVYVLAWSFFGLVYRRLDVDGSTPAEERTPR
jgi:RsiW-degrading membrane proteinase PrsW (M82 family)